MTYEEVLALPPYDVAREKKQALLKEGLLYLTTLRFLVTLLWEGVPRSVVQPR